MRRELSQGKKRPGDAPQEGVKVKLPPMNTAIATREASAQSRPYRTRDVYATQQNKETPPPPTSNGILSLL